MAPRTLAVAWKAYEKQSKNYLQETKPLEDVVKQINSNATKSNSAKIGSALARLFFVNYPDLQDIPVSFYIHDGEPEDYPTTWPTHYTEPVKGTEDIKEVIAKITINPIGVFQFIDDCESAAQLLATPQIRRSFLRYRYYAFLTELKKLPSKVMMFLLILQQVAMIKRVSDVETKHGIEKADGETYLTLLWAFKELEIFLSGSSGVELRSEYKISWYESDWSIGI